MTDDGVKKTGNNHEKIKDKLTKITANISKNLLSAQENVHRSFLVNERDLLSICQLGN